MSQNQSQKSPQSSERTLVGTCAQPINVDSESEEDLTDMEELTQVGTHVTPTKGKVGRRDHGGGDLDRERTEEVEEYFNPKGKGKVLGWEDKQAALSKALQRKLRSCATQGTSSLTIDDQIATLTVSDSEDDGENIAATLPNEGRSQTLSLSQISSGSARPKTWPTKVTPKEKKSLASPAKKRKTKVCTGA